MIEIEKPKVDIIELSEDYRYGKFVVEPLERGYGITIGNALRRILLSSLPGVAVNSIKIDGVLHEFSTVPGVKEDVTEIILALKELSATIDGEGSRTLKIEAQGPCTIKGSDIICPPDVEVLSKDLHIATLDENSKFNMEIHVDKGRGYVSAEENKTEHMPIGVLPVDSIYTPVEKASSSSNQSGLICGKLSRIFRSRSYPGLLRPEMIWEILEAPVPRISARRLEVNPSLFISLNNFSPIFPDFLQI